MASHRKFVLLWALFVSAVAVPLSKREQCARYCTEEGDFKLRPGSTYTYDYETTTTTTVQGSSQDKTQLQLTAQVDIEVISKCDLSLRLRGVTLKLSDPESPDYLNAIRGGRDFARSIEKHILRFSFQNGKVEHVCPSEKVPTWVTNIQKGVLSAFQTYIVKPDWSTRVLETDVLGKCMASYNSLGTNWQGMHTIRKTKDLSTCTNRENIETVFQGAPYVQDFQTRSLPLVKGNQECEQVVGDGMLTSATCNEKLVFRPFSSGGNSVFTNVVQKLSYAATTQRSFTGNDYRPTTEPLLFSHAKPEETAANTELEAESALKELCDASEQDISITVPRKFSAFVYKLKKVPLASLRSFYSRAEKHICPGNKKARKFFMDAIPLVGTSDSARFMYDMISSNSIPETESSIWLTSLSFVTEPTADIISAFTPLLDGRHEQALLGVSALIHNFCKDKDCSQVPEVRAAVHKLFANLGDSCYSPDDRKIILTLKALSNIGIMFGREKTLEACYKNPQIRMEARLAAIQAYRRVSCDVSRDQLMKMYSNYNEDTEMRVAAYLAVMTCPTPSVLDEIKDVLMSERINHVGSFVWTHLSALAKSKHPERQDIRDIVSNLYLMNKFQSDAWKFSTAREATLFIESIDSGFHTDSHLIFSTDSYLPRTAMFNLTIDVFGKTCNLFQIDTRLEGLEHAVERFFGPGGYFPQKNVAKLLREKRSVSYNKLSSMDEQFQAQSRFQQEPYGSLDVKIFGTSMWYSQYRENEDGTTDINLLEIVTKLAEEQEKEYSKSFMFLDTTFTVPMATGLPLKIAVNGTASVGLKIGGKFDVKSFDHVDVLGKVEPSGAIEIASLLTVEAGPSTRSGLRVVGTMHSSTVVDGRLEVRNGEVVRAQLNMPRDRIDIFNMESKVYLVHGPEEREQTVREKEGTELRSCTGDRMTRIFGVKLCSELRLPPYVPNSALHPINGPAKLSIYIQKTDPTLKSYNFDAQWKKEMKNGGMVRYGMLSLNTPDTKTDRDIQAELYINEEDHTATFKVKTPVKKLAVNAKFLNEQQQKKLSFAVNVDEKNYFSLQSDLRVISDKGSMTYIPSLEITIPSRRLAAVSGSAYFKYGQKYSGQLKIEDLTEKPILVKGNYEIGKKDRHDGEININSFAIDGTVKGYAQLGDSMSSRITAEYRFLEGKMNKISIVSKMRDLSANALTKYNGLLNIQASLLPEWNTELSFETMKTTGHLENTVSISLGDGVRSRIHTIKLQEILRYEGTLQNNKVSGSFSLLYPEKNIDYALEINHQNTESSLSNELMLKYATNKKLNTAAKFNINRDRGSTTAYGGVQLKYPGREAALSAELKDINSKEYGAVITGQWQEKRGTFTLNAKNKSDGGRLKYEVDGEIQLPSRYPITFSSTVGSQRNQFVGVGELKMGRDNYRMKADYAGSSVLNHRFSGQFIMNSAVYGLETATQYQKSKLSCSGEIKMPNRRRMTGKLEGKMDEFYKSVSFETLWDADRDTSKRFGFNGGLRRQNDGYESKFTMQIRRRTVTGLLSTSLQGQIFSSQWKTNNKLELEWSPTEKVSVEFSNNVLLDRSRQQISSHLEVATPYNGYENLTLSFTHMYANQQWDSEVSAVLPRSNEVVLSSTGKYSFVRGGAGLEALAKLHTSFARLKEIYLELTHNHNPKELSSKAQIVWGQGKRATLHLTGINQPSLLRGSIEMKSPFYYFQDISAEVAHNFAVNNYQTRGVFQWAPRKKIDVNFEGTHVLSGRRRVCTVILIASTPFNGFENTATKVTYSNDGTTLNVDAETTWNRNKMTGSFSGSFRNTRNNRNVEGKLVITTPFSNYENMQISSSLETNENSYKLNLDTQLPYQSTASLNSQGKMMSLNDIAINAVYIGHFPSYYRSPRISIDLVHKLQNSKFRSTLDAVYDNNRLTAVFIGLSEAGYNTRNVEFSATINTPFSGYEEMKGDFQHNQRGYEYFSKLQVSKNQMSGSLEHKLNARGWMNFETTLETISTTSLPNVKLSVVQVNNGGQMDHRSFVQWDKHKKINLNAQYLDKLFVKELSIKLTTPFQTGRDVEFKANYEGQNADHRAVLSAVWDIRNRMTLSGEIKNYQWQTVNAQLEFTSTFRGYEFFSTTAKYDVTEPRKMAEMSYLWDVANRKAFIAKGTFMHSYRLTKMEAEVITPFNDFEKISMMTEFDYGSSDKSISLYYERGWRKIAFNGKSIVTNQEAQVGFDFTSPYRTLTDLTALAKYSKLRDGLSGEISAQWNRGNRYQVKGEYSNRNSQFDGKLSVSTPIRQYEKTEVQCTINYHRSKKSADVSLRFGNNQNIMISSIYEKKRHGGDITVEVQSSFRDYQSIRLTSKYTINSGVYEGEMKADVNQKNLYRAASVIKFGGQHLMESEVKLNTPHSPFRNVELFLTLDSDNNKQLISNIKWEGKEVNVQLLLKKVDEQYYEAKVKLNTPIESFRLLSFESSLRHDKYKSINGRINIVTPFEVLRSLDASTEARIDDSGCFFVLNFNMPGKTLTIDGKLTNRQFRPFSASLDITAPFTSFKKISTLAEINIKQWTNAKVNLKMKSETYAHKLEYLTFEDNSKLNFNVKVESTAIPHKTAVIEVKADYSTRNNIEMESSLQIFRKVHYLRAQYKDTGREMFAQMQIESPMLPENKFETSASLSRRRNNRYVDGKLSFNVPSSSHEISAKYESKDEQMLTSVKLQSGLLNMSPLEAQAKYTNSNNRDIEVAFSFTTPESTHSIVGNLKNYESEKYIQLTVDCPYSDYLNPFSVTGTLRHTNFDIMEGSLVIKTMGKELRVAGDMKSKGWGNIEAFATINTPFEALRMLRVDGQFHNDRYQNIDCSFQMESSSKRLPSLGFSSKLIRTKGAEEVSLMLQLPLKNYRTVQLLANTHYTPDFSSGDSRITLTLSPNRYSIYGQYGINNPRTSAMAEVEYNGKKWSSSVRLDNTHNKIDVSASITTPSSNKYNVGGAYGNSDNLHYVALSYNPPSNERYYLNTSLNYIDENNFEADFKLETPFRNYRVIQYTASLQSNSNYLSYNIDYIKNGRRGFLRILHRNSRTGLTGTIHMGCPYTKVRDVKFAYNHMSKSQDQESSLQMDYNNVKQFKAELLRFGKKSSHIILDVPILPLTVTADSKQSSNRHEINFKSTCNTRIVGFRTAYQNENSQLLHDASFTWDERAEKRVSYDFKIINTGAGKEVWSRVDTPLRSFMLKGNFTRASRTESGGIDFYWDASRSLEKHVAVGLVHTDVSTNRQTSHKLQMTLEHPSLQREIVQSNIISYGNSDFHVKSELLYSRNRHHNIMLELRASDLSRSNRDSHYKAEFSLRQLVNRLDIRADGELMNSKLESSAYVKISSLDMQQRQNIRELRAKLFKLRQQIDLMMRNNAYQVSVLGQVEDKNGELNISVERKTNDQKDLSTQVKLNRRTMTLDINAVNTENTGLQASTSLTKDFASLQVSHLTRGQAVTDVKLFLGLEQSKVLKSQLNWRPRLWEELRISTGEYLRSFVRNSGERYSSWWSSIMQEWSSRSSLIYQTMMRELSPFYDDLAKAGSEMADDIRITRSTFWRMYRNNEFFMQDIVRQYRVAKETIGEVLEGLSLGCEVLCNIIIEYVEDMYYTMYYACLDFADYAGEMYSRLRVKAAEKLQQMQFAVNQFIGHCITKLSDGFECMGKKLQQMMDKVVQKLDKFLRAYAPFFIDGYYYTKNIADKIRYRINSIYTKTSTYITNSRYYAALRNYANSIMYTYEVFRDYEYAATAQAFINRIYDAQIIDAIISHPTVEYLSGITNTVLRKSVEIYYNTGMDAIVSSLTEKATNYAKTMALNAAQEFLTEFYQIRGGAKYEFAPERGLLAVELHLPTTRNSLAEVFDFKSYPEYQKMLNFKNTLTTEYYEDFCVWDFYYKFMKYFTPSYWLPTFTAHAIVSGNQHYITFDKLPFEFAGRCSYLLARDFVDGNFSVIVNYGEDNIRRSLTVLTEGKKIDISHDYKITVDDIKAESPIQIGKTVIIREGPNIRIENDKRGFAVVCNFIHNYCSVVVSGFYYGKTGGLFGTFNYEPKLDMMTPTRHMAQDIESFVNSWEVGQVACRSTENLATIPSNDYRVQQKCRGLFEKSSSEFRACFKQVDPEPYLKMCVNDLSSVHTSKHDSIICQSAAAYLEECKLNGVKLKMPRDCVVCEKQDGTYMKEGDAVKFNRDDLVQAADVVFLVEEKQCNKERVKYLGKLAQSIEENYRHKGYRDVRYSVVGFGGDEVHSAPHVHTMDGQEHGPLRSLDSALDSLEFGDGPVNILEALRFAASLNFRPGTTKSFVLLKCSLCKSEEVKAEYSEMMRTLLDGDITLHLLMEQRFEMKVASKTSKARRVIGVDKRLAYTLKDVKSGHSGDSDLLAQLKVPKDVCIPLALELNGSSFDAHFLTETKRNVHKKFMDVLSRLVVKSSSESRSDWGMCCECLATVDGVGKSTCQRCVSAEIANMISAETSGVNNMQISRTKTKDVPRLRVRKHKERRSGL